MRFATISALLSVAAAAPSADLDARAGCVNGVHVIALPGQQTTAGDMGYLTTLVNNITQAIPNSDFEQIAYPKGALGAQVIQFAMPALSQALAAYTARCPRTKVVIASYSVGGAAAMDVICGSPTDGSNPLTDDYFPNVLANVVYGDLTFTPQRHYNRGTCTSLPGVVERQMPGHCFPYGQKTRSYCDTGDMNCCSGHDEAVHFSYPGKYDIDATNYVILRWNRFQRNIQKKRIGFRDGKWTQLWKLKGGKN